MYAEEHGVPGSSPGLGTRDSRKAVFVCRGKKPTAWLLSGLEQRSHIFSAEKIGELVPSPKRVTTSLEAKERFRASAQEIAAMLFQCERNLLLQIKVPRDKSRGIISLRERYTFRILVIVY